MGHASLDMTLDYARILDETVEKAFSEAVEQMQEGFTQLGSELLCSGGIHAFCRKVIQSDGFVSLLATVVATPNCIVRVDVKCLLCERFAIGKEELAAIYGRCMNAS